MLETSLMALARLFRDHDEPGLADWIDSVMANGPDRLPQRVLSMFTHGMGGLMDRALYSGGELDVAATTRRDELAEEVFDRARDRLDEYGPPQSGSSAL
jgi:hypothetical protein